MSAKEADHVFIRGEGGTVFKLDLPLPESISDRLAKGTIVRVANADGDPYDGPAGDVPAPPTEKPAQSALKPDWVAYAITKGMSEADADASTKQDLMDRYANA